ncbi:hypothetical protein PHLGIDRAFT_212722 [Phlebiopsis gigantea 11061_1 CR5-6]|uniref:Uncharacterized protein n=1 Tax=Phlebiopsis gigantea (strain 11061_1 CR5-6) TaxID=745531 RepID=A0A0C3S6C1_PHLG1|nr:hypothetical protein PHLGIDRAFT_212722 [Phlebiopsis gigantea 11061_1 CR5-6]
MLGHRFAALLVLAMFSQYSPFFNSGFLFSRSARHAQPGVDAIKQPRSHVILPFEGEQSFLQFSSSRRARGRRVRNKRRNTLKLDLLSEFPDVPSSLPTSYEVSLALAELPRSPAIQSSGLPSPDLEHAHIAWPIPPPRRRPSRCHRTPAVCPASIRQAPAPASASAPARLHRSLSAASTALLGHTRWHARRLSTGGMERDILCSRTVPAY